MVRKISDGWALRMKNAKLEKLEQIVDLERYKTEFFFHRLYARCESLAKTDQHKEGLKLAELLCRLSDGMSGDCRGLSLAVYGAALRVSGRLVEARETYEEALSLPISSEVEGQLLQRYAMLEAFEMRLDMAMARVNRSLELLSREDSAVALVVRSKVHALAGNSAASAVDAGNALQSLDPRKNEKAYLSAVLSVGNSVIRGGGQTKDFSETLKLLERVKRRLRGNGSRRYRCLGWLYLDWVEAQLLARLGSHRAAIRELIKVRDGLYGAGGSYFRDGFLASVDLAVVYEACGELGDAKKECAEALKVAESLGLVHESHVLSIYLKDGWLGGVEKELRGFRGRLSS